MFSFALKEGSHESLLSLQGRARHVVDGRGAEAAQGHYQVIEN